MLHKRHDLFRTDDLYQIQFELNGCIIDMRFAGIAIDKQIRSVKYNMLTGHHFLSRMKSLRESGGRFFLPMHMGRNGDRGAYDCNEYNRQLQTPAS